MADEPRLRYPPSGTYIQPHKLRGMAFAALERARFIVEAQALPDCPGRFTIAAEASSTTEPGFTHEDAERYATAINNEAAVARALLLLLAEVERLTGELEKARRRG